jgi:hypothetical protein
MKFKELRSKLEENWSVLPTVGSGHLHPAVGPFNPDGAIDTPETNVSSLTDSALGKLNAFLGAAFCKPYISTANVMNQIKIKLSNIGLHFEYREAPARTGNGIPDNKSDSYNRGPSGELGEGVHQFPLTYLGGSYGRLPTDPSYDPYYTDGISDKIGTPLVLVVQISVNENNTYSVKPTITVG